MKTVRAIAILLALVLVPASVFAQENFDPNSIKSGGPAPYFNSQAYQAGIDSDKNLGDLAKQHSPLREKASAFGFSAKSAEAKFFLIGALYTESLAYVRGSKWDAASQRLTLIEREFINMGAPSSLYGFITKINNMIQSAKYPPEYIETVLSMFQPFFEEYAKKNSEDKLILFRAGAWLVNMSLTAAAGDRQLLKQPATLNYFTTELKRMDAPKGVMDALNGIKKISDKQDITDKDTQQILQLVTDIEQALS